MIRPITAPTMIIVGDADIITPEHAVELFRLRGGGVPGDFAPMPPAQLAVLPERRTGRSSRVPNGLDRCSRLPRRAHARRGVRAGMTAKELILDSKPHWAYTTRRTGQCWPLHHDFECLTHRLP